MQEATIPLGGTVAQISATLTRFATSLGIPVTGTAAENLTAILEHIRSEIKGRAKAAQTAELRAANEAALQATVEADNAL